jgi:signal transduction histidine kinase
VHPQDQGRLHEYWHDVVQGEQERHVEVRVKRVDGAYRWHLARLVPITNVNRDGLAWLGNATDVHDLKRAETEVRQVNATLEQRVVTRTRQLADVNAELEHFAYSVAHDLRAPLRGLQGLAHALREDYADAIDADGQEYLRHMITAAEHMDLLIQDLLAYSRLGRAELVLQTVPLSVVLGEARTQIATEYNERHAELRVAGELPLVCAHQQTLVQVVSNLLSNAIKFVPNNVTPCIEVKAEMRSSWVRLWIIDNGIGIASEHHQRIWNVFERLHGTEAYPGTGIGLAIVRKGIERMGGNVGVESQLGAGSRFWVELPHPEEE